MSDPSPHSSSRGLPVRDAQTPGAPRAPRTLLPGPYTGDLLVRPSSVPDIWQLTVSEYAAEVERTAARDMLDDAERVRHAAFRRQADRDRYAAAHVGLRRLLGVYLGLDPAAVVFGREDCPLCPEPHGRPCVPGSDLHFSLSHSGDLVLFAFGPTPVGVDVELVPDIAQVDDVIATLHPRERAELAALGADDTTRQSAFGRCWCRKEAYFKGTGTGLAVPIDGTYVGTGTRPGDLPGWHLADVAVAQGYAAATAYADE